MTRRPLSVRRVAGAAGRRIPRAPFRPLLPARLVRPLFRFWLSVLASQRDPRKALRELLEVYEDAYRFVDRAAIPYDGGVHVKHRLTQYHDFFIERVTAGERVLDIGCGKGELAFDLVTRSGAGVVGVDNSVSYLAFARSRFSHERLEFVEGDVVIALPEGHFDVVVLSNVLEHIEHRVDLLRRVVESATPDTVLIRVPVLARDWTVPLRRELGLPHFSDPTHFTEYDPDGFRAELAEAGLTVTELILIWGEIWATAEPSP